MSSVISEAIKMPMNIKFDKLNTKQKIVLTIFMMLSAVLFIAGLASTLLMCWQSQYGIICQTSPETYTPMVALIYAYLVVWLSLAGSSLIVMMWFGDNKK